MSEKAECFHPSFGEDFCTYLAFHLTRTFSYWPTKPIASFWCDGILWAPYYRDEVNRDYLSLENVSKRGRIVTTAWLGVTGQDCYELTILLGKKALNRYRNEKPMIDCIPSEKSIDWADIDPENQTIQVRLL